MDYVTLGTIINTRGLKGEVKIKASTDFPDERYRKGATLWVVSPDEQTRRTMKVAHHERKEGFDYVQFQGLVRLEEAEVYRGWQIQLPVDQLGALPEGAYFYHDLLGCEVRNEQGVVRGIVTKIDDHGAHPILRIQQEGHTYLFPFVSAFLVSVSVATKEIIIHEIEGMFV
ncbi:MAG: ribosome maturation factor RimM [Bacilli bacterium]